MANAKEDPVVVGAKTPTHIRYIGHPSDDENSSTSVFKKVFFRGKWAPLSNLDGTNKDKTPLAPEHMAKLLANPAFQLGDGKDAPVPGMVDDTEEEGNEEA